MDTDKKSLSSFKLNDGNLIPSIGYGTGLLIEGCEEAVKKAIETGYRHIDTARFYGNEHLIGNVISSLISQGKIKRSDLYISTKVWNNLDSDVETDVRASLKDLKLDYVDLCLVHWPFGQIDESFALKQQPLHLYWRQLEQCVEKGLVKSIGVSNFSCQILCDLLSYAKIKPAVNQIENHPYFPQENLVKFCQRYNIHVTSYCSLAKGGPTQNPMYKAESAEIFEEPLIKDLAKKYNRTIAQIILNFGLSRGISVLTRSLNLDRMRESLESVSFSLEEEEVKKMIGLNKNVRKVNPVEDKQLFQNTPLFD